MSTTSFGITGTKRAEWKVKNALEIALPSAVIEFPKNRHLNKLESVYKGRIFQGYVAPNTLGSNVEGYVYIQRISATTLDKDYIDGTVGDSLRRVRLQIDVYDRDYDALVERAEWVKLQIKKSFPSSIDSETYGIQQLSNITWNVTHVDIMITESEG